MAYHSAASKSRTVFVFVCFFQKAVKMLLYNGKRFGGVDAGRRKDVAVTREDFLAFAEEHGSIISVYQVLL